MAEYDAVNAAKRLDLLLGWKEERASVANADALVLVAGKNASEDEQATTKTTAAHTWLLGYELPETILVLTNEKAYFLTSAKKVAFLKPLKNAAPSSVELLERVKDGSTDDQLFSTLIDAIKGSFEGLKVGISLKEKPFGALADAWNKKFGETSIEKVECSPLLAKIFAPKDADEVQSLTHASECSSYIMTKVLVEKILDCVDEEKYDTHARLADYVEERITDPKMIARLKLDKDLIDSVFSPIIQSGGEFNLKLTAKSDEKKLFPGTILCTLGLKYKSYCSLVSRTLLISPTKQQETDYMFLLEVQNTLLSALKPGAILGDVFSTVEKYVAAARPDLAPKLIKNLGFATGIEFKEPTFYISANSTATVMASCAFAVSVGFHNIDNPSASEEKNKVYSLYLSDTALTVEGSSAKLLTVAKKAYKDISFDFRGEDEEEPEDTKAVELLKSRGVDLERKTRVEPGESSENKRKTHQAELAEELERQAKLRLVNQDHDTGDASLKKDLESYKNVDDVPAEEAATLKIFIDKKHDSLVLPIFGIPTPFHVSTVKNLSQSTEGEFTLLRINFSAPGSGFGKPTIGSDKDPRAAYLKEITFRSTSAVGMNNAFRMIKELQKRFKTVEAERKEKEDIVEQEDLILSKQPLQLKEISIRPSPTNKKLQGILEAHKNGFRFTSKKGDKVDLLFANIKHCFFDPGDHDVVVLFHFHLKNAIMIGKKKFKDIQFYTEVTESSFDLGKRSALDRDELEAEQQERLLRKRISAAFSNFLKKVTELPNNTLEFDVPFFDLGFQGVPHRTTVLLQPTTHALVNLTEQPPFVLTLADVERVHLERVQFHLRNFDMVFIFKDYTRKVAHINAVPMKHLDQLKEWLDSCDIKYTEGPSNLDWNKIMKTITDDAEAFFDEGGWSFLEMESGAEDGSEDSDESEEYNPSGGSDDDDDEDSDSDEDYDDEDSDEDYSDEGSGSDDLGSDESEGLEWDELEKRAAKEDRKHDTMDRRAPEPSKSKAPAPKRPVPKGSSSSAAKKPKH